MKRHLPNLLTFSRLLMAVAVFALLASYDAREAWDTGHAAASQPGRHSSLLLDVALGLFLVAAITDILDGYLARRLGVTSALGRISDPFIDKVLVCGAYAFFAGGNFTVTAADGAINVTGVATWMAVLIFSRELLVTGIRGYSERQGKAFATTVFGKAKMALQSATIAWILLYVAHGSAWAAWTRQVTLGLVWATVAVTALTALVYVGRTRRLLAAAPPVGRDEGDDA